ncbi:MAG: family 16 glycosylhydrolase [Verrucomicrobiales bacterium]|nr:family 16 glycosylhydrolase [Verrucomicrobiales bacterium]
MSKIKVVVVFYGLSFLYLSLLSAQTPANVKPLSAKSDENWKIRWDRSDDFNGTAVDWKKWHRDPENFGAWIWNNDKNASVSDGVLSLTLRRVEPTESEKKVATPYRSAMLKSYAKGNYGYYEARIKAAPLFPGVSPAFWLYSSIDDSILKPGAVRYSEVDVVELTQRGDQNAGNVKISDHNLHTILSNGKPGVPGRDWRRPHDKRYFEAQAIEYVASFDPRDDFHTYGCRVGKDEIIWYVDGVEIGRKKNEHWHRKMNVALSLGLRAPYAVFRQNRLVTNPDLKVAEAAFPTAMEVDYVRVWELVP